MLQALAGPVASGLAGACAGVGVMGTANHFTRDRSLWPVPICPHCGHREKRPPGWLPIVGPLLYARACASCAAAQPWRLAALTQLVTVLLAVLLYNRYGATLLLLSAGVELLVLTAVAVIDLQHRLIPTLLVYPTILFALIFSEAWPNLGLWSSLFGGLLAFAIFFGLALIARIVFGDGALGDGDVSLAALIGVMCGYPMVVLSLAIGALCGGLGAMLLLLFRRSPLGTTIPYGPYLVMGVTYVMLIGNTMHSIYP